MPDTVSAAEANRQFSKLLQTVRAGREMVVTSHGKPVARIAPISEVAPEVRAARSSLLERLSKARPVRAGAWTRDELYD